MSSYTFYLIIGMRRDGVVTQLCIRRKISKTAEEGQVPHLLQSLKAKLKPFLLLIRLNCLQFWRSLCSTYTFELCKDFLSMCSVHSRAQRIPQGLTLLICPRSLVNVQFLKKDYQFFVRSVSLYKTKYSLESL